MKVPYVDLGLSNIALKRDIMAAVEQVLCSGQYILGDAVRRLEHAFAAFCGVKHAVAVGSGTEALVLSMKALDIGPGDEVITVSNSFLATASAIVLAGARPVFVDVRNDFNMDPDQVEKAITRRTRALLPVHLTGRPAPMAELLDIAKAYGIDVIEDAAQAIGAKIGKKRVGGFGDTGCFSFHPLKNLGGCGDGGIITTDSSSLHRKLNLLRNHGLENRDRCVSIGINSRLDTMQAAILNVKLPYVDQWNAARRHHAEVYRQGLDGIVSTPDEPAPYQPVYHTFMVRARHRDELKAYLEKAGVGSAIHYPLPIHRQDPFMAFRSNDLPNTELLSGCILSLPVYPELSTEQVQFVIDAVTSFYRKGATQ